MTMNDFLKEQLPIGNVPQFMDYFQRLLAIEFVGHLSISGTDIVSHASADSPGEGLPLSDAVRSSHKSVVLAVLNKLSKNLGDLGLLELDVLLDHSYIIHPTSYETKTPLSLLDVLAVSSDAQHSFVQTLVERAVGLRYNNAEQRSQALLAGFKPNSYHDFARFVADEQEYRVACQVLHLQPSEELLRRTIIRPLSEYINEMTDVSKHPLRKDDFVLVRSPHTSSTDGKPEHFLLPLESLLFLLRRVLIAPNEPNLHYQIEIGSGALGALDDYIDTAITSHSHFFPLRGDPHLHISSENRLVYTALRYTTHMTLESHSLRPEVVVSI